MIIYYLSEDFVLLSSIYNNEFEEAIEILKVDNFYCPVYKKQNYPEYKEVKSYMI